MAERISHLSYSGLTYRNPNCDSWHFEMQDCKVSDLTLSFLTYPKEASRSLIDVINTEL